MDFDASEIFKAWDNKYDPGGFKAMIKYSLTSPVFHPPRMHVHSWPGMGNRDSSRLISLTILFYFFRKRKLPVAAGFDISKGQQGLTGFSHPWYLSFSSRNLF